MSIRAVVTNTLTALRSSSSTLRPFLLTPTQSRNLSDPKPEPHRTETTGVTSSASEEAKGLASDLAGKMDSSGKSETGTGSGHGVPGDTGNPIYDTADKIGSMHSKSTENPSILSSGGTIGKQFNRKRLSHPTPAPGLGFMYSYIDFF